MLWQDNCLTEEVKEEEEDKKEKRDQSMPDGKFGGLRCVSCGWFWFWSRL